MNRIRWILVFSVALIPAVLWSQYPPSLRPTTTELDKKNPPTTCEADHNHTRAGFPQCISPRAIFSVEPRDTPGYVGGGKLGRKADGPCQYDGTFGVDYVLFQRRPDRIFLGWYHCDPKQPYPGTYRTYGPKVPDVIVSTPQRKTGGKE